MLIFVKEVIEQLQTLNDYYMETETQVQAFTKRFLPQTMEKFCDLRKIDKLYVANEHVHEIAQTMSEALLKTQKNAEALRVIID